MKRLFRRNKKSKNSESLLENDYTDNLILIGGTEDIKFKIASKKGFKYEGEIKNKKPHGIGELRSPDDILIYRGEWKNGLRHGRGKHFYKTGKIYTGSWENGEKHGEGILEIPVKLSSHRYEEEFKRFESISYICIYENGKIVSSRRSEINNNLKM